jgi:hypothetical protein
VLSTEKVSVCNLAVAFLCIGFLEGNLAIVPDSTTGEIKENS